MAALPFSTVLQAQGDQRQLAGTCAGIPAVSLQTHWIGADEFACDAVKVMTGWVVAP